MNYLFFNSKRRSFIAIPAVNKIGVFIKFIKLIPSNSIKRKLFKIYIILIYLLFRVSNRLTIDENSLPDDINQEVSVLDEEKITSKFLRMYIWSLVDTRCRTYVHFFDKDGNPHMFGKFGSSEQNEILLKNEHLFLSSFEKNKSHSPFVVPKTIFFNSDQKNSILVVNSLDSSFKLYKQSKNQLPKHIVEFFHSNCVIRCMSSIVNEGWFVSLYNSCEKHKHLRIFLDNISSHKQIKLSLIHGDFGSENIFISKQKLFSIIDWERSLQLGPMYTDIIGFWLGKYHKEIKKRCLKTIKRFYTKFSNLDETELGLALCYLVSVNFDLALIVSDKFLPIDDNTLR